MVLPGAFFVAKESLKVRFTEYHPKVIKKIDTYLKNCKDEEYEFQKGVGKMELYEEKVRVKLPTKEGFAKYLKVSRKTLYNWADENPEFADALDKIMDEQKERLINMGLANKYNSTIAKLMLSHNHGFKDRVDSTTDDLPINNFNDDQIDRIADRIAKRRVGNGSASSQK